MSKKTYCLLYWFLVFKVCLVIGDRIKLVEVNYKHACVKASLGNCIVYMHTKALTGDDNLSLDISLPCRGFYTLEVSASMNIDCKGKMCRMEIIEGIYGPLPNCTVVNDTLCKLDSVECNDEDTASVVESPAMPQYTPMLRGAGDKISVVVVFVVVLIISFLYKCCFSRSDSTTDFEWSDFELHQTIPGTNERWDGSQNISVEVSS